MRIKQLECFVDLAHSTSLTKTARNMHMAIPSLSETIDRMQSEIGADLFIKTSKGYFLNDKGEMFLRDAEKIILQYQTAINKIGGYDIVDTIHFGIDPSIYPLLFSRLLDTHEKTYAEETLELIHSSFYNFKQDLLKNKIDICYCHQFNPFPKQLQFFPLFENQLCVLMSKSHPLYQKLILNEKDLYNQIIYSDIAYETPAISKLLTSLQAHGTLIKSFNSPDNPLTMNTVQRDNALMIMHQDKRDIYTADMALVPLAGYTEVFGLVYRKDSERDYKNLIETMKTYI